MAITWSFLEVNDPVTGRSRFVDERGRRGVRGLLRTGSSSQTYTTGGDDLPVLPFKEVREMRQLLQLPPDQFRSVTDGTTATNTTVTSATANFTDADVGRRISGGSIPTNARIVAVASATSCTISAAATATATGLTLSIGGASTSDVRPHENLDSDPVLVTGVPGKVKLHVNAAGRAEVASATALPGIAFFVEILGK